MKNSDIKIKEPKAEELPKVAKLLKRVFKSSQNMAGVSFLMLTVPNDKGGRYIVGAVGIAEGERICCLAVSKNYRRKGYGLALVKEAFKLTGQYGYLRVRWWNWKAIRLYYKAGFKHIGLYKLRSIIMAKKRKPKLKAPKVVKPKRKPVEVKPMIFGATPVKTQVVNGKFVSWVKPNDLKSGIALAIKYPLSLRDYTFEVPGGTMFDMVKINEPVVVDAEKNFDKLRLMNFILSKFQTAGRTELYYAANSLDPKNWSEWEAPTGKWTTRFEKYVYKSQSYKITPDQLRIIGDFVADMIKNPKLSFVIKDKFDAKDRDKFGNGNSCWYGHQNHHAICLFHKRNGNQVQVFSADGKKDIARAWMYMTETHMYIFNPRGMEGKTIASLIANAYGLTYAWIIGLTVDPGCSGHYTDGGGWGIGLPNTFKPYKMKWCKDA